MPKVADFRNYAFDRANLDASGKDLARKVYWKLYAIENLVRIIVHSILMAQIGVHWWFTAVDPAIQGQVRSRIASYDKQPWHSTPGKHEVYYIFLSDLNKIIAPNSHLFKPHVQDIDQWIARIEQIRIPRNIVGHMNWLSTVDRKRIDVFYADLQHLVARLATDPRLTLTIP
jgi:hypothetical protein